MPAPVDETSPAPAYLATTPIETFSSTAPRDSDQASQEKTATAASLAMATPRYSENPPPLYPAIARRRSYEGTVILEVFVKADGRVGDLRIAGSSSHRSLDQAALKAVKGWLFQPGRQGDRIMAMWVRVPVRLSLR